MSGELVFSAIRAKLESERLEGLAVLNVYITNPAGIGEHPQIVEEAYKALKNIESAESAIETLDRIMSSSKQQE